MRPGPPGLFDGTPPVPTTTGTGVVVREVRCRSVLNRGTLGDYSFNCYTGCTNACAYCYARYMQRFHPHAEPWGRFVDVKVNAVEVLRRQLRRLPAGSVFSCSACDGWQTVEQEYRLTRRCCERLIAMGFRLNILTKSESVLRDLDVLTAGDVTLGVTLTTPDEDTARLWEPGASSVAARVEVLRRAKAAGLRTAVMFGPLLPGISDAPAVLDRLFALAGEVGVDRISTDALNPRSGVWSSVRMLLAVHRPDLIGHYRRVLFERNYRRMYRADLHRRVRRAARHAGLRSRLR